VCALNPLYDHAAIAAVDCAANSYTWSTTHPEIHAIRSQLPEGQDDAFTDSLASYLTDSADVASGCSVNTTVKIGPVSSQRRGVRS
jgi:hypothetical protein